MPGKIARSSTLAIALATGIALTGAGLGASPALAQGKAKKAQGPSPAFEAAAAPLKQKMDAATALKDRGKAGDASATAQIPAVLAGAPALLARAEAAATTPVDKFLAGQFALNLGIMSNDVGMASRGARAMLATKLLDRAQTAQLQNVLGQLAAVGQVDPVLAQADEQVKANNPRAALAGLRQAEATAPGGRPPAAWLTKATLIALNSNLSSDALYWSARQAELYPNSLNWLTAAQVMRQYNQLDPQESIDLYRLMARSGALSYDPKMVGREYTAYAETAQLRGLYGEVTRVIDQGVAAGALSAGGSTGQLRSQASARVAADRASLAAQDRDARGGRNGVAALSTADAYLGYGDSAKAEELYKVALQKGAVDKDRALTRLGIAQFDQGKYAEARASFSQVGGRRQALARLWLTLVRQKSPATG